MKLIDEIIELLNGIKKGEYNEVRILNSFIYVRYSKSIDTAKYSELIDYYRHITLLDILKMFPEYIRDPHGLIESIRYNNAITEYEEAMQILALLKVAVESKSARSYDELYNAYKENISTNQASNNISVLEKDVVIKCFGNMHYCINNAVKNENTVLHAHVVGCYNSFQSIDCVEEFAKNSFKQEDNTWIPSFLNNAKNNFISIDNELKKYYADIYNNIKTISDPLEAAIEIETSKNDIQKGKGTDESKTRNFGIRETNSKIETGFVLDIFKKRIEYSDIKRCLILFPSASFIKAWDMDKQLRNVDVTFVMPRKSQAELVNVFFKNLEFGGHENDKITIIEPDLHKIDEKKILQNVLYFRYNSCDQNTGLAFDEYVFKEKEYRKNIIMIDSDQKIRNLYSKHKNIKYNKMYFLPSKLCALPKIKSMLYMTVDQNITGNSNDIIECIKWDYCNESFLRIADKKEISCKSLFECYKSQRDSFLHNSIFEQMRFSAYEYQWSPNVTVYYTIAPNKYLQDQTVRITAYLQVEKEKIIKTVENNQAKTKMNKYVEQIPTKIRSIESIIQKQTKAKDIIKWLNEYPCISNIKEILKNKIKEPASLREIWLLCGADMSYYDICISPLGDISANCSLEDIEKEIEFFSSDEKEQKIALISIKELFDDATIHDIIKMNPFDIEYSQNLKIAKYLRAARTSFTRNHLYIDEFNNLKISHILRRQLYGKQ